VTQAAPLGGVRVVEIADGFAASLTGRALADLGADVVKLEPTGGSTTRKDESLFRFLHAGKRSVTVPLETLSNLLATSDWSMDCLLLDSQTDYPARITELLGTSSPVVLMVDPNREEIAAAAAIWHASAQSVVDSGAGMPLAPPGHIPFYDTAMTALFAFLVVHWSIRTGTSREVNGPIVVSVDTYDVELTHGRIDLTRAANGQVPMQKDPFLAMFINCKDGEVATHLNFTYWKIWIDLMDRSDLDTDRRFTNMADLLRNQDDVRTELERWTLERARSDVERLCQERGIPAGSVLTPKDVLADIQLQHRHFVGDARIPSFLPFTLADGTRWLSRTQAPEVGPALVDATQMWAGPGR
jgi:crotonobetainyl-CoA:carnitine CoA-transferase CaiB-like acyl-CoA transferase